jgi:hypothetical protein
MRALFLKPSTIQDDTGNKDWAAYGPVGVPLVTIARHHKNQLLDDPQARAGASRKM